MTIFFKSLLFLIFVSCGLSYAGEKESLEAVQCLVSATGRFNDKGDLAGAIKDLERGYKLDPRNGRIRRYLSYFLTKQFRQYYSQKKYNLALDCLIRAISLNPNNKIAKEYRKLLSSGITELPSEKQIRSGRTMTKTKAKVSSQRRGLPKKLKRVDSNRKGKLPGIAIPKNSFLDHILCMMKLDQVPKSHLLYGTIGFIVFIVLLLSIIGFSSGKPNDSEEIFQEETDVEEDQ